MYRLVAGTILASALCFASIMPANAQYYGGAPGGSYTQSCTNISMRGNTVYANCTAPNGQRINSSLSANSCQGGDIANVNGYLTCNRNGGGGGGGYNPGYGGMPSGSYQQSCTNTGMRGATLYGSCTAPNGQRVQSSINATQCRGMDIANVNGYLNCTNNGSGGGGGYYPGHGGGGGYHPGGGGGNYGNIPAGSYQQSCTNLAMYNGQVSGSCTATNGQRVTSSLNPNQCRPGTDIANINGRITCLNYR